MARREVVGAIEYDVVRLQQVRGIRGGEPDVVRLDGNMGIDGAQRFRRRFDFCAADVRGGMDDLPVQVGRLDGVGIGKPDPADSGGGKVDRGGRTESPDSNQKDGGFLELLLPARADLGKDELAAVLLDLFG